MAMSFFFSFRNALVPESVPLVGKQHAVRLGLAQLVGETARHVLVAVRIAVGQLRHLDQLGAAQPQHVLLLLALRVRDHDDRAIAARARDHREPNAGVARGALDHKPAGLQVAALLRLEDHLLSGTILHRLAGVHELGLAVDLATRHLGQMPELDQGRVADGCDDVFVDGHGEHLQLGFRVDRKA
jgi:hypothetical protein